MRILITTFTFAPQANGVAEVAGAHAAGLAARGHEVVVATGRDPQRTKPSNSVNPTVEEFEVRLDTPPATGIGPDILRYQDFIRNFRGDVILCHCWQVW